MKKTKKWHIFLIVAAIVLTTVNILPTIFYYTKPLHKSVDRPHAEKIAKGIASRVNELESEAKDWVKSYSNTLGIKPAAIKLDQKTPDRITATFKTEEDAQLFRSRVPKAASLLPFAPSQLLLSAHDGEDSKAVVLQRRIPSHISENLFKFAEKQDENGPTPLYKEIIHDRASALLTSLAGTSREARLLETILSHPQHRQSMEGLLHLTQNILNYSDTFGTHSPITSRYYRSFTQGNFASNVETISAFQQSITSLRDRIKLERIELEKTNSPQVQTLKTQEDQLARANAIVSENKSLFASGQTPIAFIPQNDYDLSKHNPLIANLSIDWEHSIVKLTLQPDLISAKTKLAPEKQSRIKQLIYDEVARLGFETNESIHPEGDHFEIALNHINESKSFLLVDLHKLGAERVQAIKLAIQEQWQPSHIDLSSQNFPIWDQATYDTLPQEEKQFGLLIAAPSGSENLRVVAKGASQILKKYASNPSSPKAQALQEDIQSLERLMRSNGLTGYQGVGTRSKDLIFETPDYYSDILLATREDFQVLGSRRYAVLEFADVEHRILTENRIDTAIHDDLLKLKDEYNNASVSHDLQKRFDYAKPSKNTLISNIALSVKKYFRGDERKVLHWGLDLSGGKTVRIELRDQNGHIVKEEAQIKQGMDELYSRVNKMGVSEVSIRSEGHHILLDFPGSQNYSASDLIKASSMHFHVVNEQFSRGSAQRFLQEVWNEACVTKRTDSESINLIAYRHLYGDGENAAPRSDAAKLLFDQGLQLVNPLSSVSKKEFDDKLCKIAIMRGESAQDWQAPTPLMIVFNNYALEGSNLSGVRASYDPAKGNFLSFAVHKSQITPSGDKFNPAQNFGVWTSHFCQDAMNGTPLGEHSGHRGWRMAAILNGKVISTPNLNAPISDGGVIEGSFSQREINRLEADLQAGSLSFAPRILSEQNVSPELGVKDRTQGIIAMGIAFVAVIAMMVGYYRFAGVVASCAVIFNLLMMWATLQNIQAALTLAGIAGIILTVGMAVDANVLVFERVREEFAVSGNIRSALASGYKKAFTAIVDSNVTTLIAAVILLNFDSGPIKGFAITLIIGIVSSMFSALFVTRTYFNRWSNKPKNTALKMASLIKAKSFNFLSYAKYAIGCSIILAIVGGYCFVKSKDSMFGMDFTGGYALNIEVKPQEPETDYRALVTNALEKAGLKANDFQIRTLSPTNHLRVHLAHTLENAGGPFADMPFAVEVTGKAHAFETNPRLAWVMNALVDNGIEIAPETLAKVDQSWNAMSGQISESMRSSALTGLGLALLCILLYITIRFEFKFAISATLSLAHDVAISLACIAILHQFGMPIQIDLGSVAALMTIIGYSLNDTIIVFDRIREDMRLHKHKMRFKDIVNKALNVTLSRTLMTSATTLIVLLALVLFGGVSILGFALIMSLGVIIGTFSSLFIATSLIMLFHKRTEEKTIRLVTT